MWKDIPFSGVFTIFIILCIELIYNAGEFLSKKKNILIYILVALLTMLLRHNGYYVAILTMPFIAIVLRKNWKKIIPIFISIIIIHLAINFFIFNVLNVSKGSVVEMLSIPVQQIARVEKNHREELDSETLEQIDSFFVIKNIGDVYNPTLSDNVKWSMNVQNFEENKSQFFGLWLKLLFKYPKDYIESFISNSYGYYYTEAQNWTVATELKGSDIGTLRQNMIQSDLIEFLVSMPDRRDIPIISMMFSVGTTCWFLVVTLGYKIYKKDYKYILIYLPSFILWLTLVASPVFCEFRYAYPIFLSLPLYISMNLIKERKS